MKNSLKDEWGITSEPYIDFCVVCARCGDLVLASKAMIEEGDRWECEPCWEILEAREMVAHKRLDLEL